MASRIYTISVTVPAGTLPANPQITPWFTEDNIMVSIELDIPPGHNGLTGIRIMKGDIQLVPWGRASWVIGNDIDHTFPIGSYMSTHDVTIQAYNQGAYPHTFYLRVQMDTFIQPGTERAPRAGSALPVDADTVSGDPLSPDAILGPDTASALTSGDLTAADVTPVDTAAL